MESTGKRRKKRKYVDVKMDYVQPKGGHISPFVGYFPTGFDPAKVTMAGEDGEELPALSELVAFQNTQKFKQRQLQLIARTHGGVDFVGTNYTGEAAGWQPCSYALGVFNRDEGTLKLVPLAGERVLRMEPRVKGVFYGHTDDVNDAVMTPEMLLLQRQRLTEKLGSQRAKLRNERRARGLVKESALGDFSSEMQHIIQAAGQNAEQVTNEEALAMANAETVRNIPPHNLAATSPENVYSVDEMVTTEEWESLDITELTKAAAKVSKEDALRQQNNYPNFVLNRLRSIRVQGDPDGNDKRARILVYIRHLLSFYSAPSHVFSKRARRGDVVDVEGVLRMPSPVVAKFFKVFTEGGSVPSKEQRNLLISYILILGLTVDGFFSDPYDLAVELKMTVNQLKPFYLELGCKMETQKAADRKGMPVDSATGQGKFKVVLPTPLKFPSLAPRMQRRGRGR